MMPALPDFQKYNPVKWLLSSSGDFEIKGILFQTQYWMAVVIVILIFLLLFTIARIRHLYVHWNLGKASMSFLFWGFMLALILEGFLWIAGRTLLTEVIGWKTAPKPIGTALDMGRERLVDVLGATEEIPETNASVKPTKESVLLEFQNLSSEDVIEIKAQICKP